MLSINVDAFSVAPAKLGVSAGGWGTVNISWDYSADVVDSCYSSGGSLGDGWWGNKSQNITGFANISLGNAGWTTYSIHCDDIDGNSLVSDSGSVFVTIDPKCTSLPANASPYITNPSPSENIVYAYSLNPGVCKFHCNTGSTWNGSICLAPSPINGGWSAWSAINPACGYSGTQTRTCTNPAPAYGGTSCSGASSQTYTNTPCPVNGGWSSWSGNSGACGTSGNETRSCNTPTPANGGLQCLLTSGTRGLSETRAFSNTACAGTCGTSHNGTFASAPASNLCATAYGSTWNDNTGGDGTFNWRCKNSAGTDDASCSATAKTGTWTNNGSCTASCGFTDTAPYDKTWSCVGGNTQCIGAAPANTQCPSTALCINNEPIGAFDSATCAVNGITGWACDKDNGNTSIDIHIYNGVAVAPWTNNIGVLTSNQIRRADADSSCGGTASHGFAYTLPDSLKDGVNHDIHIYGINIGPTGTNNIDIGSKAISCAPPTPATLTATPALACGSGRVDLSWSAVAGATGYDTQIDGGVWTNRNNVTSYSYTGLGNSTAHTFAVRAWNGTGAGGGRASSPASVTTAVVCIPGASASIIGTCPAPGTTATVSWTASAGATYYALRVDNQADGWDGSCTSAKGDFCENVVGTSKVFTGTVSNGYTTWAHACNGTGCSLPVATSFTCIPPVPGAPATLSATPVAACGTGRVDLSWSAVTGATGYDIQIDGGVWTNRNNATSYAYTGLGNSTAHTFAVRAWNGTGAGAGRASTPSPVTTAVVCPTGTWTAPTCPASCGAAASNPPYTCVGGNGICSVNTPATRACPATAVCIPGAPANVTATPAPVCSTGKVDLSWSAVAGATGYDTQVDGTWSTDRGNVTSYTYTGLGNNAAHSFAVRAWNVSGAGAGTASTPASVTTAVQCMASISANPTLVQVGSTTNITWATAGYGNCSVAGGSDVWTALSDTRTSSPITGATIYQLTCDGAPKANVEVKVPTPPEITAEYGTITSRGNKRLLVPLNSEVTLKWKLNGQTGCIITKAPVAHPAATKGLSIADMSAGWTKLIVTGNSVYTILCTSLLDEKVTVEILSGGFESE